MLLLMHTVMELENSFLVAANLLANIDGTE